MGFVKHHELVVILRQQFVVAGEYRRLRAGRSMCWILHLAYWHLPGGFFGLRSAPHSHIRVLAG
jgi:conjugal transfer pilus assembly protein TraL